MALLAPRTDTGRYLAYDWTRPCVGGPVAQLVLALLNGGSYTVRCAG